MALGDLGEIRDSDWDRLQDLIARFETAWARGERPRIVDHVPAGERHREALLLELVHAELEFRLKAGESARVEDYLQRHPSLRDDRQALLGLIRAEWTIRRRKEPRLTIDRFRTRFPDLADDLESVGPAGASTLAAPIGSGRPEARPAASAEGPLPRRLGKFELRQRVGAGSFGVVYRAWDSVMNREVALKVPRPEAVAAPADVRAFLREARNARDLRHPNIVAILDAGPIEGTVCVVRAFVEGTTLAERLKEASVKPDEAAALMILVAEALEYAHGRGIIHRDLKPSNILLDLEGKPHISDFGLAKRESGDTTLSPAGQPGTMIGTPAYMSPEQARGEAHTVDARSDVYSAGVVLYELLAGSLPFRGRGRMLQIQIQGAEPAPLRSLNDDVPRDLETICLRAMAKAPSARYPTAQAMADDLKNFLRGKPVGPRPEERPSTAREPGRRFLVAAVAGFLAGAVVATATLRLAGNPRADQAPTVDRTLGALERLEEIPYTPGLDGPEAHRRVIGAIRDQSSQLLRSIAPGVETRLRDPMARSFLRLADRKSTEGSDREAEGLWLEAVRLAERDSPDDRPGIETLARALDGLAGVRGRLGDGVEARRLRERSLGLWERVGEIARRTRSEEVDALLGRAEAEAGSLRTKLALGRESDLGEAERLVGLAFERSPTGEGERRRLARLLLEIARQQLDARKPAEARQTAYRGIRLREEAPSEPGASADLARFRLVSGLASRRLGRTPEALDDFRRASERFESLAAEDPMAVDLRRDLGESLHQVGRALLDQPGRLDEAVETLRRSLQIRRDLRRSHPESHEDLAAMAETLGALASASRERGEALTSAVDSLRAVAADAGALALAPGVEDHRRALIRDVRSLAALWPSSAGFGLHREP